MALNKEWNGVHVIRGNSAATASGRNCSVILLLGKKHSSFGFAFVSGFKKGIYLVFLVTSFFFLPVNQVQNMGLVAVEADQIRNISMV